MFFHGLHSKTQKCAGKKPPHDKLEPRCLAQTNRAPARLGDLSRARVERLCGKPCSSNPRRHNHGHGSFSVGYRQARLCRRLHLTTLGSLSGFLALFSIGAELGRRYFLEKDYMLFRVRNIIRAEAWFIRYGNFLVALNGFIPGIRSAVSLAADLSGLKPHLVALLALLSCAVWNGIWIFLGYSLGTRWEVMEARLSAIMSRYNTTAAVLGGLLILVIVLVRFFRKSR